jgi:hypothetical protein
VEEFNNFSVAIKATTKEIALKEKKKKTVDDPLCQDSCRL